MSTGTPSVARPPEGIRVSESTALFHVGQIVRHQLFGYRGAIFDVDPTFQGTEDWYETVARSRPPKDAPWYHVMVHDAEHTTYVAERNGTTVGTAILRPNQPGLGDHVANAVA